MSAPAILAAAGLFFGVVPDWLDDVLDDYADTMPGGHSYQLELWHGVGLALVAVGGGAGVGAGAFVLRNRLRRTRIGWLPLGNADRGYDAVIRAPTWCR